MTFEDSEAAENATEPRETTVELEWVSDPMPVSEAVELHDDALTGPEQFGIASLETVRELQKTVNSQRQEIDRLRERLNTLLFHVDLLAAESDVLAGECPECDGRLEVKSGFGQEKQIQCTKCGQNVMEP